MSYLLDTCVISELCKKAPDNAVIDWFVNCPEDRLFISSLTLGELQYGIELLPVGKKKNDLIVWFEEINTLYSEIALSVDNKISLRWGELRAQLRQKGFQLPVVDGLIASTAIEHNYILVTRNTSDFEATGVQCLNPWL